MNTISYCGLICDTCPIHLATIEEDRERQRTMRAAIAQECSELYGKQLTAEDINDCDGCLSDSGRLFSWCSQCEVRKCAMGRSLQNCAFCSDFACEKLKAYFKLDASAEKRLEEMRTSMN